MRAETQICKKIANAAGPTYPENNFLEAYVRTRICSSLLVLVALLGCSTGPAPRTVRLPSGRTVRILGMGPIRIASGETGLILNYQTDLKISDLDNLRKEVDEIWPVFQVDAEKAKVPFAVISANEVPEGIIVKRNQQYNFVFQKSADGTWHSLTNNATAVRRPTQR